MAGTLPNIPLAQQFDDSGRLLRGCLLSIYAANTTTPQDSFQDVGLTIKHPWPLAADGKGRIPMFYLADGSVHVRLTDSAGTSQFDYPSMLVIGPSSGAGGGPGVDPNAIFQTGDCIWLDQAGIRAGWVRDNARTLGNSTSGASERAAADAQALYIFIWTTYSQPSANVVCPVLGGLGANALADFNAGKQITLPDKRGYLPGGLTGMGNVDTLRFSGVPFAQGNSDTPGSLCGEARHTIGVPELPVHTPTGAIGGSQTLSKIFQGPQTGAQVGGGANSPSTISDLTINGSNFSFTGNPIGGGAPTNITQLTVLGTFYRKL